MCVWVIDKGHLDLGGRLVGLEHPLDLFLRRHLDARVPFHDRLAGQRIPGLYVGGRETQRRTAPHGALLDNDGAPTATALSPARDVQLNARF